jgi:hypothetical protein
MRPLYEFQVAAGRGHGQHSRQEAVEAKHREKVEAKARSEKESRERSRNEQAKFAVKLWTGVGTFIGGVLGLVVGFFKAFNVETLSLDTGTWLVTLVLCAGIGALLGLMIGHASESQSGRSAR